MSASDPHHQVQRGHQAQTELRETEAAFEAVKAAILKTLAETPIGQESKVLNLHKALQNLAAVRQALMQTFMNGQHGEYAIAARDAISGAGLTRP